MLIEEGEKMKMNEQRHRHLLECIKNICFAYENFESQFLEVNLSKHLLILLVGECVRLRGFLIEKMRAKAEPD
jgi:hypothetical protein